MVDTPKISVIRNICTSKNVVISCESKEILRTKQWYELNGKKYSCSQMLVVENDDELYQYLEREKRCLIFSKDCIKDDKVLSALYNNGVLVTELKDLDYQIQKELVSSWVDSLGFDCLPRTENLEYNHSKTKNYDTEIQSLFILLDSIERLNGSGIKYFAQFVKNAVSFYKESYYQATEYDRIIRMVRPKVTTYQYVPKYNEEYIVLVFKNIPTSDYARALDAYQLYVGFLLSNKIKLHPEKFANILFPNQNGKFKELKNLCEPRNYCNGDKDYLLHQIISSNLFEPVAFESSTIDIKKTMTVELLNELWPNVDAGLKAMLLFITMQELYRDKAFLMVNQHNNNDYFTKFLEAYKPTDSNSSIGRLSCELDEAFRLEGVQKNIVVLAQSTSDSIDACSITGEAIRIPINKELITERAYSNISLNNNGRQGNKIVTVIIRPLKELEGFKANTLVIDLLNTLLNFLFERQDYGVSEIDYKPGLGKILYSKQANIDATRENIKTHIDYHLSTIKIGKKGVGAELSKKIKEIKNLEFEIDDKEASHLQNKDRAKIQDLRNSVDELKRSIVKMIIDRKDVSNYMLDKVRAYLSEVQYDHKNIPLELFQNADDAVVQRGLDGSFEPIFSLKKIGDKLVFEHNGRDINEFDGIHDEWRQDLINMLSFSSSKNSDNEAKETGKFGFGFKSSYFITDEPRIFSGKNISARIIGGSIPEYIPTQIALSNNLTRIELPLNDEGKEKVNDVLDYFKSQIEGLLLFSLAIKNIEFDHIKYIVNEYNIAKGLSIEQIGSNSYLAVKCENGDIAFKCDKNGLLPCKEKMARFWSTTPLRIDNGSRYLLNSLNFKIDMGRQQIAYDNNESGKVIQEFAVVLCDIINSFPIYRTKR